MFQLCDYTVGVEAVILRGDQVLCDSPRWVRITYASGKLNLQMNTQGISGAPQSMIMSMPIMPVPELPRGSWQKTFAGLRYDGEDRKATDPDWVTCPENN